MTASDPTPLATPEQPAPEPGAQPGDGAPADQLPLLRDLIARAYPDAVPELIQGDNLDAMLACIPDAQAAWARVAEAAAATPTPPNPVPAGNAIRSTQLDVASLTPLAKIRHGLTRE